LPPDLMELRNRFRHQLAADAMFTWEGPQEELLLGEGLIRDISLSGTFILSSACPPVGTQVQLDICLDPNPLFGQRRIRILTEAKVVRVEHSQECEGFATMTEDFTLLFNDGVRNESSVSNGRAEEQGQADETKNEMRYSRILDAIVRRNGLSGSG
jgi:hypothetical protein